MDTPWALLWLSAAIVTTTHSASPSTTLVLREVVTVEVEHLESHGNIMFSMCDDEGCSTMEVKGAKKDGSRLWFDSYTGCDQDGGACLLDHDSTSRHNVNYSDYSIFKDGKYVFEVRRNPSELTVAMQGHIDIYEVTGVPASGRRLQVRSENRTPMPVKFIHDKDRYENWQGSCLAGQFACKGGLQCIKIKNKCSGVAECEDGSDEDSSLCNRIQETNMTAGDVLSVRVKYDGNYTGIMFLLCDLNTCSKIVVTGSNHDGALMYTASTGCNTFGGSGCTDVNSVAPRGWKQFSSGNINFEVQRRATELAVWLQGSPDRKATVPVWRGSSRLRVRPVLWTTDMPVELDGPHCGIAPLAPQVLTVNGEEADLGAFPWHAGIYRKDSPSDPVYICGGSLVSRTVVISVSHCFYKSNRLQPASNYSVALGKLFSEWDHDEVGSVFKSNVKRLITHPAYRGIQRNYGDDVALLEIERGIEFSDYIQPICINEELRMESGEKFMVVGWGGGLSKLASVILTFQTLDTCLDEISKKPSELSYITSDKFCSLRENGKERPAGVTQGDSGGGAVAKRGDRWFLIGLVSVSLDKGKVYGFTDLSKHNAWATRIVEDAAIVSRRRTEQAESPESGSGTTTRGWDCCKTTCGWRENAGSVTAPVRTCARGGTDMVGPNVQSGCVGGSAFVCNDQQPFIQNGEAYAFVAANVEGLPAQQSCCTCYRLTFTDAAIAGKVITVQVINSGVDFAKNQFNLQIPGGGLGYHTQGCPAEWPLYSDTRLWGEQYGGVISREECNNLPGRLIPGCQFRFDWMQGVTNASLNFNSVPCPSALTAISGCSRLGQGSQSRTPRATSGPSRRSPARSGPQ